MDLGGLDVVGNGEKGRFLGLLHPQTGEPLSTDDEEVGFLVRSAASPSADKLVAEVAREDLARATAKKGKGDGEGDPSPAAQIHESLCRIARACIISARGLTLHGDPVETSEQIAAVLELWPLRFATEAGTPGAIHNGLPLQGWPICQQVHAFVSENANFTEPPSGG